MSKITHEGRLDEFLTSTYGPAGASRIVGLRETKKFWFDEYGRRYSKDGGWPIRGYSWRLILSSIVKIDKS